MIQPGEQFVHFLRPHWRRLHAVARQYVAAQDAADLVQETVLRAWRNFSPAQEVAHERAWLLAILRNIVREWQRTGRRRVRLEPLPDTELTELAASDLGDPLAPLPSLSEQQFREMLDERLAGALDALEPPFREVILLSVAGDLNYREIAEVLRCPVGTVMSRMSRARRMLRERLARNTDHHQRSKRGEHESGRS